MPLENKKQILIIAGAVIAGIAAVILTSNYVKTSIEGQTASLAEQYDAKQKGMASQIQQRSDQQMAVLAQELERTKSEQAAAMQKQIAALQETQRQQAQQQARELAQQKAQQAQQAKQLAQQQAQQIQQAQQARELAKQQAQQAQEAKQLAQEQARQLAQQLAQQEQARMRQMAQVKKVRKPSLALKTPVGKRAVTVMIDSLAAVGGLINPGDFVDVIAQLNVPFQEPDKKTVTAMIFQGLQVLAINTNENDPGAYDDQQAASSLKITFAVDPQEAGLLAFASKNGSLELALRSPNETGHQLVKADTWKTLADYVLKNQGLDIKNPDEEVVNNKPVENKPNIQIFRGGKEL